MLHFNASYYLCTYVLRCQEELTDKYTDNQVETGWKRDVQRTAVWKHASHFISWLPNDLHKYRHRLKVTYEIIFKVVALTVNKHKMDSIVVQLLNSC